MAVLGTRQMCEQVCPCCHKMALEYSGHESRCSRPPVVGIGIQLKYKKVNPELLLSGTRHGIAWDTTC